MPYPAYGALYINRLICFVGPRKRSAAGQSVPDSVPVVVPDGGYALSGLQSPVYQPVTLFRRPAQAQRRRAICTRLRSRRCAGWRLTPYPAYGALYINRLICFVGPRKRSAAGQAVPICTRLRSRRCAGWRLRLIRPTEPCISNGYSVSYARASAAPPGNLYQTPFPSLCRMAANALSGLRSPIYQPVTLFRRPAQAQRRRASCTRLRSRRCAGWRLTPYPAYLHPSSKACASRGIPIASDESPHPHDDTFVFCLVAKLNR